MTPAQVRGFLLIELRQSAPSTEHTSKEMEEKFNDLLKKIELVEKNSKAKDVDLQNQLNDIKLLQNTHHESI